MLANRSLVIAVTGLCLLAGTAKAELYYGAKLGSVISVVGLDSEDRFPVNLGAVVGYDLGRWNLSLEGEVTGSIIDGKEARDDFSVTTVAGFGAWRLQGTSPLYLKLRAGGGYTKLETERGSDSKTSVSAGAGLGYMFDGGTRLEVEFTGYNLEFYQLSLGVLFR
ncbi:MAG: outer membrane beta-barrel protein [Chromatiales bacterium]|nr:outer membrane beta-barrel protein [Chromatiales bacterium]